MAVAVIADAHVGGPGGDAAPLVAQLDALAVGACERLVLLGDLFQGWIGFRRFETPDIAAVTAALERLRARGVRVDCIEGNRDFFLAGSAYAAAFDAVVPEVAFTAGGVRYLAIHGDGLDDRDWQYRFWRAASKSWLSRQLVSRTPRRLARRLVASTEERLSRTNFKHKVRIPEEVVRRYAASRLAEGHDVLLLGHFHEEHRWTVPGGEVHLLEAWFTSRRIEWFPPPEARP
ncbi:MAG TPA: UDP-2,3-diacylglucosamine diphosphatase [Thermoanaerobaculia bacterium]|nr:UDP-2,3-diacylglucosamine diphosphatase [Thermoanaerobaculia bacterium]